MRRPCSARRWLDGKYPGRPLALSEPVVRFTRTAARVPEPRGLRPGHGETWGQRLRLRFGLPNPHARHSASGRKPPSPSLSPAPLKAHRCKCIALLRAAARSTSIAPVVLMRRGLKQRVLDMALPWVICSRPRAVGGRCWVSAWTWVLGPAMALIAGCCL